MSYPSRVKHLHGPLRKENDKLTSVNKRGYLLYVDIKSLYHPFLSHHKNSLKLKRKEKKGNAPEKSKVKTVS